MESKCSVCKIKRKKLMKCSLCKSVLYCGIECQGKDWGEHKEKCKTLKMEREKKEERENLKEDEEKMERTRFLLMANGLLRSFLSFI